MAVPKVNENLLGELEAMGFPLARATRGLHYSGNTSLEDAINWIVDHENDPDIDQMPLETIDIRIDSDDPFQMTEEMTRKAQQLRDRARLKREEEEKRLEREREKERIRSGKELFEAKRNAEENEKKRYLALRQSEKVEEKRARERIRWKLEQDKLERKGKLAMAPKHPAATKHSVTAEHEKQNSLPIKSFTKAELMGKCLRALKSNHMNDDARVRRAFQTLLIYIGNVARKPNEEKYRRIRMSNPLFQERVGSLKGGVEFLELCGFERTEGGEFLYLPQDKASSISAIHQTVLRRRGELYWTSGSVADPIQNFQYIIDQYKYESWIARGEEKSAAMEAGLHASPLLRRRENRSISSESRRQPYSRTEESELQRTELRDLIDLAGRKRNSAGRLELVAEDWALSEEEERNGQREKGRGGV
ncbi:hypothetical protein TIFTF001_019460 [Ficus carica]|uniref:UBA domain-containing protein n=1 Tax=Ficus carica TaxID=3494 RepID=A0AA88AWZ2_FICCA|nr:hypothetical protein TIFTF001_019460 [Ficus carica]